MSSTDTHAQGEHPEDTRSETSKHIAALVVRAEEAEQERDDARKERDSYMTSYKYACNARDEWKKERDEARALLLGVCGPDELPSYYPIDFKDDGSTEIDRRLHCVFCDGLVEWEDEHKPDCVWWNARAALEGKKR